MVAWLMLANLRTRDQINREEWVRDMTGELSLGFSGIHTSRFSVRPFARQLSSSWENAWASLPLWAENSRSLFLSLFVDGNRVAHNCRAAFLAAHHFGRFEQRSLGVPNSPHSLFSFPQRHPILPSGDEPRGCMAQQMAGWTCRPRLTTNRTLLLPPPPLCRAARNGPRSGRFVFLEHSSVGRFCYDRRKRVPFPVRPKKST